MQTINHSFVTPPILTKHTPPISAFYQPPTLNVNVGSQPYIFPNPFDHAHIGHFSPSILFVPIVGHDHTPQPTPIFSTRP
jgi:hypothetical protein